ncbi:MAG: hypothetical protein ACLPH3_02885 [Terracidiphilus sp.]
MQRSGTIQPEREAAPPFEPLLPRLQNDPRWSLAQRVVSGSHFARSPLLSKFLLFVVAETIKGHESEITEHQIGVQVFDRPRGYRTIEDNIVRNYARQLRKRLAEHFASEGSSEPGRIDVPVGGYVPVFSQVAERDSTGNWQGHPMPVALPAQPAPRMQEIEISAAQRRWRRWAIGASLLLVYSAAIVCVTWIAGSRVRASHRPQTLAHPLWATLFGGPANTYIVPADAGFNLLEDLSRRPLSLADYIKGGYLDLPLSGVDAHSAEDLRSQRFTSFVDFQIVAALSRLPEYDPQRVSLRFPRDLRLDDLKNSNAILIGSVGSNPWASIGDSGANFRIVYRQGMQGATIINTHPQSGEASSYLSQWNEPAHETFALIAFLPNLGGTGHLLLLQGLDVAGTQAAAETILRPAAIDPILKRATRPDGSLRFFEILLRSTSIESNSAGTQVIASRIY